MSFNQETIAPFINLENQVRIFLYDNSYLCEDQLGFLAMFNLLSNATPIQYLFKELLSVDYDDGDREFELKMRIGDHLFLIIRDFRMLASRTARKEKVQEVWFSLYEVYIAFEEAIQDDFGICDIKEFEPFLES